MRETTGTKSYRDPGTTHVPEALEKDAFSKNTCTKEGGRTASKPLGCGTQATNRKTVQIAGARQYCLEQTAPPGLNGIRFHTRPKMTWSSPRSVGLHLPPSGFVQNRIEVHSYTQQLLGSSWE